MLGQFLDVGLGLERIGIELPELGEGRVVELEAAVGAQQRDAFLEVVQRLALYADQLVVAAFERQLVGHVLIEIGDAAEGVLLAHDVQRAAVGQVPPVLARLDRGIGGELLGAPLAVVCLLRDAALVPEPVKDFGIGRVTVEPIGIERPECGIGGVVEAQALVGTEDGDRRVELVQCRGVGLDVAVELLFGIFQHRHVDGEARRAAGDRNLEHVERAHRARDHRMDAAEAACGGAGRGAVHGGAAGELGALRHHEVGVARIDGGGVALVDPQELAFGTAQPDRQGCGIEHGAEALHLLAQPVCLMGEVGDLAAFARQRPEAQRGKAARGAAVGLQQFVRHALDGDIERRSVLAEVAQAVGEC